MLIVATNQLKVHDLYCSQNIIVVIKLRMMRWTMHVSRMKENIYVYTNLFGET